MGGDWTALAGKTALITGGGKRLGRAIALRFAREGVHVALHHNTSAGDAGDTVREARRLGVNAWLFQADLREPEAAAELVGRAAGVCGGLDMLVNNASIFGEDTLAEATVGSVEENVRINALSPMFAARAFAAQGRPGAVLNLLDTMTMDYDRRHASYHLSKRMLQTITRMMALEYAPGIRVNAVSPGLVLPPAGKDDTYLESLAHSNPLHRHGSEEGVAEAAVFLMRGGFITGQTIYVDGGRHLRGHVYE